jgi:nitrogen-specific signal transduction histidine kinase/CheY-like chemotaxis protein
MVRDAEGLVVGLLGVARDITAQKTLEGQLRQSQKIEAVGQLAGGLAHDFNNLLTVILGFARLLEDSHEADDPRRLDAGEIRKAGERAAVLTRQLLAFSRKQILQPVVINLNDVIQSISRMVSSVMGEHVTLELHLDPNLAHVKVDRGQVEQVVVNLAVNGRDAMERGGTLTIETSNVQLDGDEAGRASLPSGSYVMLSVRDTGVGMTPEIQQRIFEPFFTTKAVGKGTGLGLAMVFGIAKQSDGAITVDSSIGQGSTFNVYFPKTDEPAAATAARASGAARKGSETVLVVDDESGVLTLVAAILKRSGYRVLTASDPQTAAALLASGDQSIDLLLTDVVLLGADGPTLFADLRSRHPTLRVLYMSGFADDAIVQRGVFAPGTHFISKPFVGEALLEKVREALN